MTHYAAFSDPTNETAPPTNGWRRVRPQWADRRTTFLFWPAVLALGCLSLACVCWGASSLLAQKGLEKGLRIGFFLPKLISNHGERKADAFRMSEPVPSAHPKERATQPSVLFPPALDHPKVTIVEGPRFAVGPAPTVEPPSLEPNEPWLLMVAKVEGTAPVETCHDPVVYLEPCASQRGESPMMRNWKTLTMVSLMTAATFPVTPPLFAGEPKDSAAELKKSIDALIQRIDALEKKPADEASIGRIVNAELKKLESGALADIKKSIDQARTDVGSVQFEQQKQKLQLDNHKILIDLLASEVRGLEKKLLAGGPAPTPTVDKAFMEEFRTTLKTLNDTLAKLGPTQTRNSMSPPISNGAATGSRVMLANHYPDELLFIVNGVGHRLPARSTKLVDVAAGALNYEVFSTRFGVLERQGTSLASGDTFNLTAR